MSGEFTFTINEKVGVLCKYPNGWSKELNVVSWNDEKPKFDIRDWNPEHTLMTRGVTLKDEEMMVVYGLLKERYEGVAK